MNGQRVNQAIVAASIEGPYITALLGPRRVGKTYFVENYAKQHPDRKWVFFNMDQLAQRQQVKAQLLETLIRETSKQHIGVGQKLWVVIDEAQKCPELFDQIKTIYDTYKAQNAIKFIITGSAVLSLHQLSAESLAGRIELHHVQTFNLRESAALLGHAVSLDSILDLLPTIETTDTLSDYIHSLSPFKPDLEQVLKEQLLWGGFPELLLTQTVQEKISYLNNYLQTYLEKDIRALETISDLNLYRNLLDILAEQTGSVRDDQRIVAALGCTRDTLKKYRGYVEATLLFTEIYPYIGSSLKRLVKSPKGYLLSNGLMSLLTGLMDLTILEKTGLIGHRLENWFLNELQVWIARSPLRQSIHYWRTISGVEVDFVVVRKPHVFPFEITYSVDVVPRKVRNLQAFLENEPKARFGYYIYRGNFKVDLEKRIIFIPCWVIT